MLAIYLLCLLFMWYFDYVVSFCSSVSDLVSFICRVLLLNSKVWSQPTVEKLTVKKKEARKMTGRGEWQTGWNWPVCCVGDSSPVKRPSSGISSSQSSIRWLHQQLECLFTPLQTLHKQSTKISCEKTSMFLCSLCNWWHTRILICYPKTDP